MTKTEAVNNLLAWWRSQIGYREGANNYTKYAEDAALTKLYGWKPQNQPWCDIIYDEGMITCFGLDAASKLTYQPIGAGSALCRQSAQYYKDHNAWFTSPEPGDQIFFYYSGAINHTGIVESVEGGAVHTIEGNTSDIVARRTYSLNNGVIAGYGRPCWVVLAATTAPSEPTEDVATTPTKATVEGIPTVKQGDESEVVRAAQFLLNGRGASCGIWGADGEFGAMTRAAVLAFQRRNGLESDGIVGNQTWAALLGL